MTIPELIKLFAAAAIKGNELINKIGLLRLDKFFKDQKFSRLRVFVSRASGYGHQANTVTIIKRFIDLGFVKEIDVIYDYTEDQGLPTTIEKLATLLPGLNPQDPKDYMLGKVKLTFTRFETNKPKILFNEAMPLCVNGGAEFSTNFCEYFNVEYYLQLQPFKWKKPDAPNALWKRGGEQVLLTDFQELGAQDLIERAFYVPIPAQVPLDFAALEKIKKIDKGMVQRAKVICDLFEGPGPYPVDFYPIYGLPYGEGRRAIIGTAISISFVSIVASALAQAQTQKPIVIAILSPVVKGFFEWLDEMFSEKPLPFNYAKNTVANPKEESEFWFGDDDDEPDSYTKDRAMEEKARQWAIKNGITTSDGNKVRVVFMYEPNAGELNKAIQEAKPNTIIVTALINTPQVLFNHLFEIATFPGIFEGQGTANYALNCGKPYFHLANSGVNPYPTGVLNSGTDTELTERISKTVFGLLNGIEELSNPQNPAEILSTLINDCINPATEVNEYFRRVKEFYHAEVNDKLLMVLLWWLSKYNPDIDFNILLKNADGDVLQTLYDSLKANADGGKGLLALPAVLDQFKQNGTETITGYLAGIIGSPNFNIGSKENAVTIVFNKGNDVTESKEEIIVKGITNAFGESRLEAQLIFTLATDKKKINANLFLTIGNFNLPGVEWFKLDAATITAEIPGDGSRIRGNANLSILFGSTSSNFVVRFPTIENLLLFEGNFATNPPDIDKVFQLVGGVDFASSLPDPIKVITKTGLKDFTFLYNYKESKIESFRIHLENKPADPWVLVGKLQLTELDMEISVLAPTGDNPKTSWVAKSAFQFNNGVNPSGIIDFSIGYPKLKIGALLREGDENKISLNDLFTFFLSGDTELNVGASLSDFEFTMNPSEDELPSSYLLRAALESDEWENGKTWSFKIKDHSFSLDEIRVEIQSNGKEKNERDTIGYLQAVVSLFANLNRPEDTVTMNLLARYLGKDKGWLFSAKQGDRPIKVLNIIRDYVDPAWADGDVPKLDITGLFFQIAMGGTPATGTSYLFGGKIGIWADTPFGEITADIRGEFGYFAAGKNPFAQNAVITTAKKIKLRETLLLPDCADAADPTKMIYQAFVEGQLNWNGIDLRLFFDYNKDVWKFGMEWNGLLGYITQKGTEYEAKLSFTEETTIGSIVERMISWATGTEFGLSAPWNLLDNISLSNLELVYTFKKVGGKTTDGKVSLNVNIGPIDLGFASIKGFKLSYNNGKEYLTNLEAKSGKEVIVSLEGSFFWQTAEGKNADDPISWNAADPEDSKQAPGEGNKYFDLRYLGMGQHITFNKIGEAKRIEEAIEIMSASNPPSSDQIPEVKFDAQSNWLIGADFGVLKIEKDNSKGNARSEEEQGDTYFITAQLVFNDPYLYGLRLALAGEAAKIFKGLDFQIMYRQISETMGVYQSEIALPDYMRRLTIGAYTIVLPVFAIAVYTNGDFQIDVGFPWNENFSRSLTVEAMIGPIPVVGSAGFYFGKLSSETSDKVPAATNGTFNPVIVFGFGFQIGVGKSFEVGIFKAGFSLTVLAIIEGVIAKWNPFELTEGYNDEQVQGQYYFYLNGTLGIAGKLYGSLDFAIIKAEVNIELALLAQIIYESFEPIIFTVFAKVRASASLVINLGLFKIEFSFKFDLDVKQTFYIDNNGTKPWTTTQLQAEGVLRKPVERRLYALRMDRLRARFIGYGDTVVPVWSNLQASESPGILEAYLGFAATLAGEEVTEPSQQQTCCIATMVLAADPVSSGPHENFGFNKATGLSADKAFDIFSKKILLWCLASTREESISETKLLDSQVTEAEIKALLQYLDELDENPTPIPIEAIDAFFTAQFKMTVSIPAERNELIQGTFFPMPPKLKFKVSADAYPGYNGFAYSYSEYNSLSADYLEDLRDYFDDIGVQVQKEETNNIGKIVSGGIAGPSLGEFIVTDYFLLIARHMLRGMNSGLRNFVYPIVKGQSIQQILDTVNGNADRSANPEFVAFDLFEANAEHELMPDTEISSGIQIGGGQYFSLESHYELSFQTISRDYYEQDFTGFELAVLNAGQKIIKEGLKIQITTPGKEKVYQTNAISSLATIATELEMNTSMLLQNSDLLTLENIFINDVTARLELPYFKIYVVAGGDSFDKIALQPFGKSAADIALLNAAASILNGGIEINYTNPDTKKYITKPDDRIEDVAYGLGNISLTDLFTKSDILANTQLLQVTAQLEIPPFYYKVLPLDTITKIADKFSVSIALLADNKNNYSIVDLFSDASSKTINISHLDQYKCSELLSELQRAGTIEQLGAMVSRYYFHSLRLPTKGIYPHKEGMWVSADGNDFSYKIPDAGIFALSGQQFPVPALVAGQGAINISFDTGGEIPWLAFASSTPQTIEFKFSPVTTDPGYTNFQEVLSLADFARGGKTLASGIEELRQSRMYTTELVTYAFSQPGVWLSGNKFTMPYSGSTGTEYNQLQLWKLPDGLMNLLGTRGRRITPSFRVKKGAYNEASGKTDNTFIDQYAWSSIFKITVKKIIENHNSPNTKWTYEILGTNDNDIILLDTMMQNLAVLDGMIADIVIAFGSDNASNDRLSLKSADKNQLTFGVNKINLSTDSNPPTYQAGDFSDSQGRGILNLPASDFVKLIWEASITRSGGFYLFYFDAASGTGLPDEIFNDKNEAVVFINLLYSKPGEAEMENRLYSFVNQFITGETFDLSKYSVFAEGIQREVSLTSADLDLKATSLEDLKFLYLGNIDDIAPKNKDVKLRPKSQGSSGIKIPNGSFMVSPLSAEKTLKEIAARFNVNEEEITKINPKVKDWNGTLPEYLAIKLPPKKFQVPDQYPDTLGSIAEFFGEDIVALAWENADIKGIFADTAQISFSSGAPTADSPTVPAGVVPYTATRKSPAAVSTTVDPAKYAEEYLPWAYSLLGYRITENQDFGQSRLGLPVGPANPDASLGSEDKVNFVRDTVEGDKWEYELALKYTRLVDETGKLSPYAGIGKLLQVQFKWEDLFGNKIISDFDSPVIGSPLPLNNKPVIVPYSDPILGLGKWPGVSPDWTLSKDKVSNEIALSLRINFDTSLYEGLLKAYVKVKGSKEVTLVFSVALDKTSAELPGNYIIPGIKIISVAYNGAKEVVISVSNLSAENIYQVIVKGIKARVKGQPDIKGDATFNSSDETSSLSSLSTKAKQDFESYRLSLDQLNDPNGLEMTIFTSFLNDEIKFTGEQKLLLTEWITSIAEFIKSRSDGSGTGKVPAKIFLFNVSIIERNLKQAQIQLLSFEFIISRVLKIIAPGMEPKSGILEARTFVNPRMEKLSAGDQTIALEKFARDFETACNFPDYLFKIAVGIDRYNASGTRSGGAVWTVRLSKSNISGISCSVINPGKPVILAPRPVANELKTEVVDIMDYQPGIILDPNASEPPKVSTRFEDVDVDLWMAQFLMTIDNILSPEFISAMQLLQMINKDEAGSIVNDLLTQKKAIASLIKKSLIVFYADEGDHEFVKDAQDVFEQQLLERLVNAYNTRAGIQFTMKVVAELMQEGDAEAPKLFGPIIQQTPLLHAAPVEKDNEIHLSSPKLSLRSAIKLPISIMLSGPAIMKGDGDEIIPSFSLKLSYQPNFIEHQIGKTYTGDGYRPSSWLHFLIPESPLNYDLGEFEVPSYLRAFPTAPDLIGHDMGDRNAAAGINISDIKKWDYQFTYSQNIHYPHDTVYCEIDFNIAQSDDDADIDYGNLFPSLAQFMAVLNPLYQDIEKNLLPIVPSTAADDPIVKSSATALQSFKNLIDDVIDAATEETGFVIAAHRSTITSSHTEPLKFSIREGSVEIGREGDALLVSIFVQNNLEDEPHVKIKGYNQQRYTGKGKKSTTAAGVYEYYFVTDDAQKKILSAKKGQAIADRTVVIPGIDIIERQDAYAAISVKRNEFTKDMHGDRKAADSFVYTSGKVRFNSPLYPTITDTGEINIAQINQGAAGNSGNTLYEHLFNLISTLLKNNSQDEVVFQLQCSYHFSINDALNSPVPVPLMFYPRETINVKAKNGEGLDRLIKTWRDAVIKQWYPAYKPVNVKAGRLSFDLTIMSNLKIAPKPYALVHLPNLYLDIKDVSDLPPGN